MELPFLNVEDEKVRPSAGNLSLPSSRQSQETNDPIDYDKTGEGESMADIFENVPLRFFFKYFFKYFFKDIIEHIVVLKKLKIFVKGI